jgi:hypothetical protein
MQNRATKSPRSIRFCDAEKGPISPGLLQRDAELRDVSADCATSRGSGQDVAGTRIVAPRCVDGIRIGVGRHRAISLDDGTRTIREPHSSDAIAGRINWDQALVIAGFDPEEREAFDLVCLAKCPRGVAAKVLGWSQERLARVSRRIQRKLPLRLGILREAIDVQLANAIPSLDPAYLDVLSREQHKPQMFRTCRENVILSPVGRAIMTTTLKTFTPLEELAEARKRLSAVIQARAARADELRVCEAAAATAESAARAEQENALLDDRDPDKKLLAAVAPAQQKLTAAEQRLSVATGAVQRQQEVVNQLGDRIQVEKRQRLLASVRPKAQRLLMVVDELQKLALEIHAEAAATGEILFGIDLFPPACQSVLDLQARVMNSALDLARYRAMFVKDVA